MSYLTVDQVMKILGVSSSKAYAVMRQLNSELKAMGFIVVSGKVPIKFFCEHYYADPEQIKQQLTASR
jgi:sugar-specific transcriptional regulator TrmB